MQQTCYEVFDAMGIKDDPLLNMARKLEQIALSDPYFIERKLYPTSISIQASSCARWVSPRTCSRCCLPWPAPSAGSRSGKEMIEDTSQRIGRPRQLYVGRRNATM